ncbi:MAG: nucleoside-triphosphatase [Oscillospiraceae bacterium]|nr:nucleoside-triphosphatase [Oscillospiraceae bacterium]
MKRKIFLSGPAFSGKSGMIREVLGSRLKIAGGFCTELSQAADGGLQGCSLLPAAMAGGEAGFHSELFLDLRRTPPGHDNEVFRVKAVRLLEEAAWYPFAVLDEIGGLDLAIPQFRVALTGLLGTDLPVLGVLKSREETAQLRELFGLGERFLGYYDELYERLRRDPDTEILTVPVNPAELRAWRSSFAEVPGTEGED